MNAKILELARIHSTAPANDTMCFTSAQALAFARSLARQHAGAALSRQQIEALTSAAAAAGVAPQVIADVLSRAQEGLQSAQVGPRGADALAALATDIATASGWDETNDGVRYGNFWTFERDTLEDFALALLNEPVADVPAGWALVPRSDDEPGMLHS